MPDSASSDLVGCGLRVVRGPMAEMAALDPSHLGTQGVPQIAEHRGAEAVLIRQQDLHKVVGEPKVQVEVTAIGKWKSPATGNWAASLLELDVDYLDYGLDATLVGLADRVSERVTHLLSHDCEQRQTQLPLLLGLWLEDQAGRLGTVLERSAVLVNWEFELDAC